MSGDEWVRGGPQPPEHRCDPPDRADQDVHIPLFSVWECPSCGEQWMKQFDGDRRPMSYWVRLSRWNRRKRRRNPTPSPSEDHA